MTLNQQILADLNAKLSPKRFSHTLGVVDAAEILSKRHFPDLPQDDVVAACLLHDITKECSAEEHSVICATYGETLSAEELSIPKLLHAKTGALLAEHIYHAKPEVVSAVRWHTTGRAGMTPLETVVYLADYIEMGRTFPSCVRLREYYEEQYQKQTVKAIALRKALLRSFDSTIKELLSDKKPIDRNTVEARNHYLKGHDKT